MEGFVKVLDVEEIKQSLSTFSFSEDDTKFKPPKKTKGGKDNICHLLGSWILCNCQNSIHDLFPKM